MPAGPGQAPVMSPLRDASAVLHVLRHALDEAATADAGQASPDIPALASLDTDQLGIAYAAADDALCVGAGEWLRPFSLQSVAKVFALALLVHHEGGSAWSYFSTTGNEDHRTVVPMDGRGGSAPGPMTNAGAMVIVDRLIDHHDDVADAVARFISAEAVTHEPLDSTRVDEAVAASEMAVCHRNRALAHLLTERGRIRHAVDEVVEQYIRLCALSATCRAVALAGTTLARAGVRANGRAYLGEGQSSRLNAVMMISGAYADSGKYAVHVGLPLKTGVGGGLLAVVPGHGALCAWSPGLDPVGTPIRALTAVAYVARRCQLSVFGRSPAS